MTDQTKYIFQSFNYHHEMDEQFLCKIYFSIDKPGINQLSKYCIIDPDIEIGLTEHNSTNYYVRVFCLS